MKQARLGKEGHSLRLEVDGVDPNVGLEAVAQGWFRLSLTPSAFSGAVQACRWGN